MMDKNTSIEQLLSFYMGKTWTEFIIKNLKVELDVTDAV
jgi:topoisomerase-4 subunit B